MPSVDWKPIPKHYAPRQVEIIEQARAHAEQVVDFSTELTRAELIAQVYINGYSAGWDAAMARVVETGDAA